MDLEIIYNFQLHSKIVLETVRAITFKFMRVVWEKKFRTPLAPLFQFFWDSLTPVFKFFLDPLFQFSISPEPTVYI